MTDFTIVLRSLSLRRFSTTVTVTMVAVSVALLLVLLAMRDAGRAAFRRGTGNAQTPVRSSPSSTACSTPTRRRSPSTGPRT
jgi:hypothetical protein